jgi:hypothetical protein
MVLYKTPKSSTTKARVPGTPRAKQQKRSRPLEDPTDAEREKKKRTIKHKKPNAQASATIKSPQAVDNSVTLVADADKVNVTNVAPTKRSKNAGSKGNSAVYTTTLLDDVDSAHLQGQHSRTHKWMKVQLSTALAASDDGIVNTSDIPNFIPPVRDELQKAYIRSKAPLEKMRFSKKSTNYIRMLLGNAYKAKIQDLYTLNALTGKQTMSMPLVWAERQYRAALDLVATSAKNKIAGTSCRQLTVSMLKDLQAAHTKMTRTSTLAPDNFEISQSHWDSFVATYNSMRLDTRSEDLGGAVGDVGASEDLRNVADQVFGCTGVWSAEKA